MTQARGRTLAAMGWAVIVLLALAACENQQAIQRSRVSGKPAAYCVTAQQLVDEYNANRAVADRKYKGRVLQVSGTVTTISEDVMNHVFITLCTDKSGLDCVQCYFADSERARIADLRRRQPVQVKGLCDGKRMDVSLNGCELQ